MMSMTLDFCAIVSKPAPAPKFQVSTQALIGPEFTPRELVLASGATITGLAPAVHLAIICSRDVGDLYFRWLCQFQ